VTLQPGTRLGPYEVLSALGAGGMGEVYKACDMRLDRTVAVKILPEALAADPQFRDRFDREARAISQLDHPHICALYDVGEQAGTAYLVMQHLDGETLTDRLAEGALPIEQALKTAIEIASALDAAHRAGIVHRDLKPGNIMLTKAGAKLLDFGLAKSCAPVVPGAGPSMLPTTPPTLTAQGTILGTFQYMAPEQLEGQEADARTDIFAFGAVLYEMLTGRKAFEGKSQASLIGAILKDSPPAISTTALRAPPLLDRIVHVCLAKDPDARWQGMGDVRRQLEWVGASGVTAATHIPPPASPRRVARFALAAVGLVAVGAGLATLARRAVEIPAPVLTLSLLPPADATFTPFGTVGTPHFALSPDGRRIAVVVSRTGRPPSVWIRSLDSTVAQELPGTDDASSPFWSPDGESVGFVARGKLKRIGLGDGRPEDVANIPDVREGGGAWSSTGVILFHHASGPLSRIRASGGPVETATPAFKENPLFQHRWPQFLPDGRRFLYSDRQTGATYLGDLDSDEVTEIFKGGTAVYAPPGFLLFPRAGMLWAQTFDSKTLRPVGDPRAVVDRIGYGAGSGYLAVSASANGILAYWDGTPINGELLWFDRSGKPLPSSAGPITAPGTFSLAPDGRQIAFTRSGDVWLLDTRGSTFRFSFTGGAWPIWSEDGLRLFFRTGQQLVERSINGAEKDRAVGNLQFQDLPTDWSAKSRLVVLHTLGSATAWDIGTMSLETGMRASLLQSPANEIQGRIAPDGRWIAYVSDETGQWEVYVQPFPLTGANKRQISVNGGSQPTWRRDGQELFFLGADRRLMAVSVEPSGAFSHGTPQALFDTRIRPTFTPFSFNYATTDGQRFLVNSMPEGATPTIGVITNWTTTLKE
jgi:eukaryotic-like serine/threonine-protein kinase